MRWRAFPAGQNERLSCKRSNFRPRHSAGLFLAPEPTTPETQSVADNIVDNRWASQIAIPQLLGIDPGKRPQHVGGGTRSKLSAPLPAVNRRETFLNVAMGALGFAAMNCNRRPPSTQPRRAI